MFRPEQYVITYANHTRCGRQAVLEPSEKATGVAPALTPQHLNIAAGWVLTRFNKKLHTTFKDYSQFLNDTWGIKLEKSAIYKHIKISRLVSRFAKTRTSTRKSTAVTFEDDARGMIDFVSRLKREKIFDIDLANICSWDFKLLSHRMSRARSIGP